MEQESRGWRWERGGRSEAPGCTPGSNRSTRPSLCPSIPALDGPFKAPRSCSPHPHPPPHKAPTGPKGVPSAGGRWAEHPPRGGLGGVPGPGGSRSVTAPAARGRTGRQDRPAPTRPGRVTDTGREVHGRWGRSSTAPRRTVPVPGAGSRVPGSRVPVPAPGTGSRFPIPGALGGRRERNFSSEEPVTPFGLPVLPRFPVPVPGPPCLPPTRNGP